MASFIKKGRCTSRKARIAVCTILSLALIVGGALTTVGTKSAFAQSNSSNETQIQTQEQSSETSPLQLQTSTNNSITANSVTTSSSSLEQYILLEQPQMSPLITSALSPANVTLPQDLSDIISLGSQLATKEFASASSYQNNNGGNPIAAARYAQAASEIDRHLLQLVGQYELDAKLNKEARYTVEVARISYPISDIQRKQTMVYEITKAAQNGNVTLPDLSDIQSKIDASKQDIQNAISNIVSDPKQTTKSVEDAEKKMQGVEKEISAIWKDLSQQLQKKIGGEHRLDKVIGALNDKANSLEAQAKKLGNSDALSEVASARTSIQNASQAIASGDLKLATQLLKDARIHLYAAQSLLG